MSDVNAVLLASLAAVPACIVDKVFSSASAILSTVTLSFTILIVVTESVANLGSVTAPSSSLTVVTAPSFISCVCTV